MGPSTKLLVVLCVAGCSGVASGPERMGGDGGGSAPISVVDGGRLAVDDILSAHLDAGVVMGFRCPAVKPPYDALWGTFVYTYDSPVCVAAVHAGAMGAHGGAVVVSVKGPQAEYLGSTRAGITSDGYGAYGPSYSFLLADGTDTSVLLRDFDAGTEPLATPDAGADVDAGPVMLGPADSLDRVNGLSAAPGRSLAFVCPPMAAPYAAIWGTFFYAPGSAVCVAALQVGVIDVLGGPVTVNVRGQEPVFAGSTQAGITSLSLGSRVVSYSFQLPDGTDSASRATRVLDGGELNGGMFTLTDTARGYDGPVGQRVGLTCPGASIDELGGAIWGNGVYTLDSRVCLAAVHAGVASPTRPTSVVLELRGAQSSYQASFSNGLSSSSWGPYPSSYAFVLPDGGTTVSGPASWPEPVVFDGGQSATAGSYAGHAPWRVSYRCPALSLSSAWTCGSGVYSADSPVCYSAVHAGVLEPDAGGEVLVVMGPSVPVYLPSRAHGVSSSGCAAGPSMTFSSADGGSTYRPLDAGLSWPLDQGPLSAVDTPITTFSGALYFGTVLRFDCPPQKQVGFVSVWGTGVYTPESRVCPAGVHAGALSRDGGTVLVVIAPGEPSYQGSTSNDFTSTGFGAHWESFFFVLPDGGTTAPGG